MKRILHCSGKLLCRLILLMTLLPLSGFVPKTNLAQATAVQSPVMEAGPLQSEAKMDPAVLDQLGIPRPDIANMTAYSQEIARVVVDQGLPDPDSNKVPEAGGLPENLHPLSPFSAAVITTLGGRNTQYDEVSIIADIDGTEDLVADHSYKVNDFSDNLPLDPDWQLTRAAISEHTRANGFPENIFYYGDSVGNVYIKANPSPITHRSQVKVDLLLSRSE